ncbi:hypothetical protein ACFLZ1_04675 [Patescibacteria group bacterium]
MFNKKIKNITRKSLLIIFFGIIILPLIYPLLKSGFYPIHDNQQVARLFELDLALKGGQFPIRWVKNLGFGYGYPLFNFYPPFLYYLAEVFHLFGVSFIWSIKLIFILSFVLAGLLMYLLAKDFQSKWGAFIASIFYLYLPYRAVDSYVRGALAELLALSWLPGLLWAGGRIFYLKKVNFNNVFYLGFFIFLLMTTHNLTMLIFAPFFILWVFLFFLKANMAKRIKRLKLFILGLLLGVGYSCFFWLPSLLEKKFTLVDQILLKKLYDYRQHFVYLDQLWDSPFGYGGSLPGRVFDDISGMSFEVGKVHLVVAFIVLILSLLQVIKKQKKTNSLVSLWTIGLLLASVFMSLSLSQVVWDIIKPIWYIQFPWRFLGVIGLFVSLTAGFIISKGKPLFKITIFILLTLLVVLSNKNYFKPIRLDQSLKDEDYINEEVIRWDISRSSFEYLPNGIKLEDKVGGLEFKSPIEKENIAKNRFKVIEGEADINITKDAPHMLVLESLSDKDILLQANIFSFPGWKLFINEKEVGYFENDLKLISFKVPGGKNIVRLEFTNTLVRTIANLVTLTSFLLTVFLFLKKDFFVKFKK